MAIKNPVPIQATKNIGKRWLVKLYTDGSHTVPIDATGWTFDAYYVTKRGKSPLGHFTIDYAESNLSQGQVVFYLEDGWTDAHNVTISQKTRLFEFEVYVTEPLNTGVVFYGSFIVLRSSV